MMDFQKFREIGLGTKRQLILGEITMQGTYYKFLAFNHSNLF